MGGLVFYSTKVGDAATISATTNAAFNSWTTLASSVFSPTTVEGIFAYLPGQQWMMFGGGDGAWQGPSNKKIGKIEADGTVTQLNDLTFDVGANTHGEIVGHPNGRVFGIDATGLNLLEYNEIGDSWSSVGLASIPITNMDMSAAVMIPEFDVIYLAGHVGSSGPIEQWIYKL